MNYKILEDTPYGGQIFIVTSRDALENLPTPALKLLSVHQANLFQRFPGSINELAAKTDLTFMADWLHTLASAENCRLEICLTKYASSTALLRFMITDNWSPALSFEYVDDNSLPYKTPTSLRAVYKLIGSVNLHGYGYAGGLLCPPEKYPALDSYHRWRAEGLIDVDLDGYMAFYQTFTGDSLLVNEQGQTAWYVHDDIDATRTYASIDKVLPLIFEAFTQQHTLKPYGK